MTILSDDPSVVIDEQSSEVEIDQPTDEVEVDEEGVMPSLDYTMLARKPSINDVTLVGDKSLEDIGVGRITNQEIRDLVGRHR